MRVLAAFAICCWLLPVSGGVIVLKNKKTIKCKGAYEVKGDSLRYYNARGDLFQIPLKLVDLKRSTVKDSLPKKKARAPEKKKQPSLHSLVKESPFTPDNAPITMVGDDELEAYQEKRQERKYRDALEYVQPSYRDKWRARMLLTAIVNQDVAMVRHFITSDFPTDGHLYDESGSLPLLLAVQSGYFEMTKLLLESGANPNLKHKGLEYPLTIAIKKRTAAHRKLVPLLYRAGASVSAADVAGQTALHMVIDTRQLELMRYFLEQKVTTYITDREGVSPLLLAVNKQMPAFVTLLLAHGADPNHVRKDGVRALTIAVERKNHDMVKQLLESKADVQLLTPKGSLLYLATRQQDLKLVRLLLKHGADPLRKTNSNPAPLEQAVVEGHPGVFSAMWTGLSKTTDPAPYLLLAVEARRGLCVQLMLTGGADPSMVSPDGDPILVVAARNGDLDMVTRLLEAGADVYAKGSNGLTAYAVTQGPQKVAIKNAIRAHFKN